ncbi:hypothetical protein GUITHDRAFT_101972 [Guillardia theta CCMP2712]|uniref:Mitochondrial carrier protein n=1 Tax=Guillardia theta (strain CCMP2712) TaxID=905079 RepID=L1JUH3_GUITC|nr:hypothetical protein GUITHDRAFT_101972 [Guillardia theta CCMP2712]EKX52067.1 hypothetical protein GUITHDRAFT_101972 [Guillardia theta CCMP2712]|eukprot:XP_005839047.1 hypothetical protein GUITHDRAFT_101972 [Guillardia theta CCMP2712]
MQPFTGREEAMEARRNENMANVETRRNENMANVETRRNEKMVKKEGEMRMNIMRLGRSHVLIPLLLLLVVMISESCAASPAGVLRPDMSIGARVKNIMESIKDSAFAGASGRFVSVLMLHPVDTIKTRAQVVSLESKRTAVTAVYRSSASLAGVAPSLVGNIANGLTTCLGFEVWRRITMDAFPSMDRTLNTIVSAVLGDITGHVLLAPTEVLKTRLQLRMHTNVASGASHMLRGGIGEFYRGYPAMLLRDVPYRALQLVLFDEMLRRFAAYKQGGKLEMKEVVLTGAGAGCAAAVLTTPFDLMKSQLMASNGRVNALNVLRDIGKEEGRRRIMASLSPRVFHLAASTAAFYLVYDSIKQSQARKVQKA